MIRSMRNPIIWACALGSAVLMSGCARDNSYQPLGMWDNARLEPYEKSPRATAVATLAPPVGTIARGELRGDDPIRTGRSGGQLLRQVPFPVTPQVLERGQERYNVYCSPCHARLGNGEGLVVQRGFPHPPDFALRRLRNAPVGHFYDVITHGYGVMYSYAHAVPPTDRWAIAAYIRVLQKARPEVTEDRYEAERTRARERGIQDPARPMRTEPGAPPVTAPDPHAPGAAPAPGGAPAGGAPAGGAPAGGH